MKQPLYKALASTLQAYHNCIVSNNQEWEEKHAERVKNLVAEHMPSGSGIDAGIYLDFESSKPDKLIFTFSYHHMDDGYYDGWTSHKLTINPSLAFDFDMRITGENHNNVKDYFYDTFNYALYQEVE